MTTIKTNKGEDLKVRGTIDDIIADFTAKGAKVLPGRANNNLMVWINGQNTGEIVVPEGQVILQSDEGYIFTLEDFLQVNTEEEGVDHISAEDASAIAALLPGDSYHIHINEIKRIA